MPKYLTPTKRLRAAHQRARIVDRLTLDDLDVIYELYTGQPVTTDTGHVRRQPNELSSDIAQVHKAIHATHVSVCCAAVMPGPTWEMRREAHGPLAHFAVDAVTATTAIGLDYLVKAAKPAYDEALPHEQYIAQMSRNDHHEATALALRWAAISATTTGYTHVHALDRLWDITTRFAGPHITSQVRGALRALVADGAWREDLDTLDTTVKGLTA